MKKILIILSLMLFINVVSAVPQIINTQFNLTISGAPINGSNSSTGNYSIFGEGGQLTNSFPIVGNCSFSYNLNNIPLIFSREIQQNDTDVATLIHSLVIFNNMSADWKNCTVNLANCMNDVGYKGNYTQKAAELEICYKAREDYSSQIKDLNEEIANLTTWRNFGVIAGMIGIACAVWLYRKQTLKKADNPYKAISGVAIQH